ncbi:MAG: hypothetical protein M1819_005103 [Sarea resinae]|nr:MAG: hypothetical protein M1819_005103 [Sarea resinae]
MGGFTIVDAGEILYPMPEDLRRHDGDWPEFKLSNVTVHPADNDRDLTSLFLADKSRPVTVVGRLCGVPENLKKQVRSRTALTPSTRLKLTNVDYFAYGQYEDEQLAIWAASDAGWFEIRPAREYKAIYNEMILALNLLYFLVDKYKAMGRKKGKKGLKGSAELIFQRYAENPKTSIQNAEAAAELFYAHREFIIRAMLGGKDGIAWSSAPFYKHMQERFPADFAAQRAIVRQQGLEEWADRETEDMPSAKSRNGQSVTLDEENVTPTLDSDEEGETRHGRKSQKGKSTLRPKSYRYSNKAVGRRGGPMDSDEGHNDIYTDAMDVDEPGLKRKQSDPSPDAPARKRTYETYPTPEGGASSSSRSSVVPKTEEEQLEDSIPLKWKTLDGVTEPPPFTLVEDAILSTSPDEYTDIWHCPFDTCAHKVCDASTEPGRERVQEHIDAHAFEGDDDGGKANHNSEDQLTLVLKEQRPHLPVSHLLDRIREMAATEPLTRAEELAELEEVVKEEASSSSLAGHKTDRSAAIRGEMASMPQSPDEPPGESPRSISHHHIITNGASEDAVQFPKPIRRHY